MLEYVIELHWMVTRCAAFHMSIVSSMPYEVEMWSRIRLRFCEN